MHETKLILLTGKIISIVRRHDLPEAQNQARVYLELKKLSDASWVSFGIGIVCGLAIAAVIGVIRCAGHSL